MKRILPILIIIAGLMAPVLVELATGIHYLIIDPIAYPLMMYIVYKFCLNDAALSAS